MTAGFEGFSTCLTLICSTSSGFCIRVGHAADEGRDGRRVQVGFCRVWVFSAQHPLRFPRSRQKANRTHLIPCKHGLDNFLLLSFSSVVCMKSQLWGGLHSLLSIRSSGFICYLSEKPTSIIVYQLIASEIRVHVLESQAGQIHQARVQLDVMSIRQSIVRSSIRNGMQRESYFSQLY